ncbi:unnamed protein product [Zymoseptoria tritici ST99CH_1A5]|uniref:DUF7053 domain-containing protein n=1 Tax=Zymoseptoria tritici ST99CH_1A5 TaxID=1276529 RepID=A0A1Y6L3U9_ZYMTR|nr:unnamed protein product [Zymoseptoria tritici ST99CH_3D1]SMY18975.1 unnamed protein product [Zymoseptoria tritici ST99CH_1A5]
MPSRSLITNITPLPAGVSREAALAQLHDHDGMIKLNPLVIRHEVTTPPPNASQDEAENATWYEIADSISYLGLFKGEVVYKACFYNLPRGIQTHVFAPAGVDIRSKWSVCGNAPGEPREPVELGSNAPRDGLYVKEELDLRCNFLMAGFVKKNLKSSHAVVVDKILEKAGHVPGNSLERNDSQSVYESTHSQMSQSLEDPRSNTMPVVSRLQCACTKSPPHDSTCIYSDDANRPDSQPLETRLQAARFPSDSASSRLQPGAQTSAIAELYGSPSRDGCMCTGGLHDAACQSSGLRVPPVSPLIMPDVVAPGDRPVETAP